MTTKLFFDLLCECCEINKGYFDCPSTLSWLDMDKSIKLRKGWIMNIWFASKGKGVRKHITQNQAAIDILWYYFYY